MTSIETNNMYLRTTNSFRNSEIIECFRRDEEISRMLSSTAFRLGEGVLQVYQQIESLQRILSPIAIEIRERFINMNAVLSPVIVQMAEMTQKLYETFNPVFFCVGQQTFGFMETISSTVVQLASTIEANRFEIERLSTMLTSLYDNTDFQKYMDEDIIELSEEQIEQIEKMAQVIISDPINWEQRLHKVYFETKEKHPVSAAILLAILSIVITILINVTSDMIFETINRAKLREEPSTNSTTIMTIEVNQIIHVVDEVPYYFEVEFTNSETGQTLNGWLSKKSVKHYFQEDIKSPSWEDDKNE